MKKKALFLDRDGVINIDRGYVYKIEDFIFKESIFALCKEFKEHYIFVITNQSGIGRGYYSEDDFEILTSYMCSEFEKHAIKIDAVFHCPHHPKEGCMCRKPDIGMIEMAKKSFDIDIENSTLIGDKQTDIECGKNAGIKNLILIS